MEVIILTGLLLFVVFGSITLSLHVFNKDQAPQKTLLMVLVAFGARAVMAAGSLIFSKVAGIPDPLIIFLAVVIVITFSTCLAFEIIYAMLKL